MTDYIKRKDAIELAKDSQADLALEGDNQSFAEELESVPSADVAPVRHGKWMDGGLFGKPVCSECGEDCIGVHGFDYVLTNYCPFCGAKMDE